VRRERRRFLLNWPTSYTFCLRHWLIGLLSQFFCLSTEEMSKMRLNKKAGFDRFSGGIGLYFGAIKVQLFAPHQSFLLALLHNGLKETSEDLHAIALTDTGQAGMIG